jgi:hypothetical protein
MEDSSYPSRYRVVVRGGLGPFFASAFEEFEIARQGGETSLTGCFTDGAQLHGLFDRLRDFGISIVSVNPVESDTRTEAIVHAKSADR